jgi:hypothetical protein
MKIKTFRADNAEDIDKLCNEFEETHNVKATQSHITPNGHYVYVLFYMEVN